MTFRMIKLEDDGSIGIPCYQSDEYRWIVWGEDEAAIDILKRHSKRNSEHAFSYFTSREEGEEGYRQEVTIYEMVCCASDTLYFLCIWYDFDEFDSIYHSVALPYNYFNLLEFFNKHFSNSPAKKYMFGEPY